MKGKSKTSRIVSLLKISKFLVNRKFIAIGYWLLAIGYWLLAIGYWLLAIGWRWSLIGHTALESVSMVLKVFVMNFDF
jgi:hypothetical protein